MFVFILQVVPVDGEPRLTLGMAGPYLVMTHVECVLVLLLEVCLIEEQARLVEIRFTIVDAECGTRATLVAEVVDVEDLSSLR